MVHVEVLGPGPSDVDRAALADLTSEFSASAPLLSREVLDEILGSEASRLVVARVENEIVGMLTLVIVQLPTIVRAWIEDVVVAASSRRLGVGTALMAAALEEARSAGARIVDLTSRPARESANAMYRKLGFEQRETNVYRYDLRSR